MIKCIKRLWGIYADQSDDGKEKQTLREPDHTGSPCCAARIDSCMPVHWKVSDITGRVPENPCRQVVQQ